ncbi:MAG: hypothetical protein F6K24_02745 [Okeania sp. SIO2D1]|nr:hypothetical protein [Okeania sp. SIO2D1]
MTINNNNKEVSLKPETRNHKGFFIEQGEYKLMSIDESGWALICLDDAVCHYVDPDNLEQHQELIKESVTAQK